ncbi:MAG: class I poly(R)-hydroxyalkanoic acid synthase [Betaproteobacteria bacterium]|nr:MAG: class I poly(R)-hydroxyalkanoic acid synthase [Betaproteobacteria bacterium]
MPASPTKIEAALQQLLIAAQAHSSEFVQSLPLRDADVAELNRALLTSEHGRQRLLELQQNYLRDWLEIMRSSGARHQSAHGDRRFSAPEWSESPWFGTIRALYQLNSKFVSAVTALVELPPDTKRRLDFFSRQLIDAMSPANFPITNPQAITRAFQSDGESLAKGAQAFAADLARGRIAMSDESVFEVGRNLAITPGDVVFENELIQLLQYRATTQQMYSRALLIVPPFINKYYILDLQPHNSFVRYCVDQGITTFIVSWRNIPEQLGHLGWDDYINKGIFDAIEVARSISGSETINALGYCVGGTLLASALAVKTAQGENPVSSLSLLASMLDFSDTGEISVYVDEGYVERCEQRYAERGLVPGSQLAGAFASLRANELVWYFVVNNYLLGDSPRAFDLLYWNADSANLPGPLYAYYLRNMYLENRLRMTGALRMQDTPVDLAAIDMPSIVIATREDHIVPWRTAYRSVHLLGGETEFVLGASGHVAGIVNPPQANQRQYWISDVSPLPDQAVIWLDTAHETGGSWWPHWMNWLQRQSGNTLPARKKTGNRKYQPLEAAPGRYVRERHVCSRTE